MLRREFLGVLSGAAAWPVAAHAQPARTPRIGYLFSFTPTEGQQLWEACRQGLRELGYVDGKNIVIEARWAAGTYERLPDLIADLIRLKVDVIITGGATDTHDAHQ